MKTVLVLACSAIALLSLAACSSTDAAGGSRIAVEDGIAIEYDARAASALLDILQYVRGLYPAPGQDPSSGLRDEAYDRNVADPVFRQKVDALLRLPVYDVLAANMRSYAIPARGRNAYRQALFRLPYGGTQLRGGVDEQLWELVYAAGADQTASAAEFIGSLAGADSARRIVSTVGDLLPEGAFRNRSVRVFVYFDGNRGSFDHGGSLYLDLMNIGRDATLAQIENTIAHELHHEAYGRLLPGLLGFRASRLFSSTHWMLCGWQRSLLLEGTAQFCNWGDEPSVIRDMTFDPELSRLMFEEWQDTFLAAYSGRMSSRELTRKLEDYSFDFASARLEDYLSRSAMSDPIERRAYAQYRPVVHYFVGYRIFRAIFDRGGAQAFVNAMTHPRDLLSLYRELCLSDPSLPPVSEEFANAWAAL